MRKCFVSAASLLAFCFLTTPASAQWAPLNGNLIVSVNGGGQIGSSELNRRSSFDLYDETATVDVAQPIKSGGLLDLGAALKVRDNLGVGLAYTRMSSAGDAVISGQLPHPLFFDAPRSFSQTVGGLDHEEQAVHIQALYFMPFTEKVDFIFSAGPSFFTVKQGLARGVAFSEVPPDFNSVTIDSVDVATLEENAVGFNIGADAIYTITRMFGAGVLLRYTRGTADFDLAEGQTASVKAGNFQIAVGLRARF